MNALAVLTGKSFLFGFLVWLIPFFAAFPIFPLKEKRPLVFKTAMSVALAVTAAALSRSYLIGASDVDALQGLALGGLWALMSIAIDLPIFLLAFKMKPVTYLTEIALGYLVVPAITWGQAGVIAALLRKP